MNSFWPNIISFAAGFLTAVFAEPLRQRLFGPKLKIEFEQSEDCITPTSSLRNPNKNDSFYIRTKITNEKPSMAKNCKGYLINVERKEENGEYSSTIYCDSIQLAWSCQKLGEEYIGLDIAKGVNQYLDIIETRLNHEEYIPKLRFTPIRYSNLFKEKGWARFTIQISADRADPQEIKLEFHWTGKWDHFEVR